MPLLVSVVWAAVISIGITAPVEAELVPEWHRLAPEDSADAGGRSGHTLVLDAAQARLIAFGSYPAPDELWALELDDPIRWNRIEANGPGPSKRIAHTAIIDPIGGRMIVFGGGAHESAIYYNNETWSLSLGSSPAWTPVTPLGTPPRARQYHAAAYDPVRRRMIVFGGQVDITGGYVEIANDLWELTLADTLRWRALSPISSPPTGRYGARLTYDPVHDRMLLFGGYNSGTSEYSNDVWVLSLGNPPSWTPLPTSGTPPAPRYQHGQVLDVATDQLIAYGGWGVNRAILSDVCSLDLSTGAWTTRIANVPGTGRAQHAMAIDPIHHVAVSYGGEAGSWPLRSLDALPLGNPTAWSPLAPAGVPSAPDPSASAALIIDPQRDEAIVELGWGYPFPPPRNVVWRHALGDASSGWEHFEMTGTVPFDDVSFGSAVYDPVRRRQIVMSLGVGVTAMSLDAPGEWIPLLPSGTPPQLRFGTACVYDPQRDRVLMVGGYRDPIAGHNRRYFSDIWSVGLSGASAWQEVRGDSMGLRVRAVFLDAAMDRLLALGLGMVMGSDQYGLWSLPLAATEGRWQWEGGAPTSASSNAVFDPLHRRLLVYLPIARELQVRTLGDPAGWVAYDASAGAPSSRSNPVIGWDEARDRIVLFGGAQTADGMPRGDLWTLRLLDPTPALASLVSLDATPRAVLVRWHGELPPGQPALLERRVDDEAWRVISSLSFDGLGDARYEDTDIRPGQRLGYRLAFTDAGRSSEAWTVVPRTPALALAGAWPNPASADLRLVFTLASDAAAQLELFDLSGRRVHSEPLTGLQPGVHTVRIRSAHPLGPGLYLARLVQQGVSRTARIAIVY